MKLLINLAILFLCCIGVSGQTYRKEICVGFRVSSSEIDLDYGDNASNLAEIVGLLTDVQRNPNMEITGVSFCGSASPEGRSLLNKQLVADRCASLEHYIRQRVDLPDSVVFKCDKTDVWQKLAIYVERSDMLHKDDVLYQIRQTPEYTYNAKGTLVDSRKKRLMDMNFGRTWNYMLREFFPSIRNASILMVYIKQKETKQTKQTEIPQEVKTPIQSVDTIPQEISPEETQPMPAAKSSRYFAIKTNMLYDALAIPNIGVEVSLGRRWSLAADWMYAWWSNNNKHRYWRVYGGGLSARKWFGHASEQKPLQGHHIGINAQILTYDIEFGGKGYMAGEPEGSLWNRLNYAFGAEYGYSMPIAKRLNIDFSLVAGYMGGRYYEYIPIDGHYVWQATNNRHWWGPTKIEVTLVWLLGNNNYNVKKGGNK